MAQRLSLYSGALVVALVTSGCGATEFTTLSSPTALRCQATVAAPSASLPAGGAQISVPVQAARECAWTASSDTSWIQVSPAEGQGSSELTIVAAANQQPNARSASLIVNDQRLTIRQDPLPCQFAVNRTMVRIEADGGSAAVAVSATDGCTWSASTSEPWLRVRPTSGRGPGSAEIEAQPNTGEQRTGLVSIAGLSVTVTQDRPSPLPLPAEPVDPPPGPPAPLPNPGPIPAPVPVPLPVPVPVPPVVLPPHRPTPAPPAPQPVPPGNDDGKDDGKDKDKDKGKDQAGN